MGRWWWSAVVVVSSAAQISAGDRLTFTFVVAVLLHALIIFGVRFVVPDQQVAQALEVTLVRQETLQAPTQADYLAQANQQGSGELDEARLLTTTEDARLPSEAQIAASAPATMPLTEQAVITTIKGVTSAAKPVPLKREPVPSQPEQSANSELTQQASEIAAMEARLAARREAYAKRPRVHTLSAVSARADGWANYLDRFRVLVEAAGNEDYPIEAKARKLEGQVRLLVAILPNGRVQNVKLLKSSGEPVLDAAAIRSVHLAEPYGSFPTEQRGKIDVLQIVRTWQFSGGVASNN